MFSTGSSINSNFEISQLISLALFSIKDLSPINIGVIKLASTACLADSIAVSFTALTITALTGPLDFAYRSKFSGQIISFLLIM